MDCLHRYTMRSVHKFISIDALLAGTLTLLCYNTKKNYKGLMNHEKYNALNNLCACTMVNHVTHIKINLLHN